MSAPWPATEAELVAEQLRLAATAFAAWEPGDSPLRVAACFVCWPQGGDDDRPAADASAEAVRRGGPDSPTDAAARHLGAPGDPGWAAAVCLRGEERIATATVSGRAPAAYAPGLLALREGPLLEAAVQALGQLPAVLIVNATGRDHPRRAGLALQLGERLGVPTIGVTNRPLFAAGEEPSDVRGATSPLTLAGEVVAAWVRTRRGTHPLVAHAAWRTSVATATRLVLACCLNSRTPEPLRAARRLARETRARAVHA